MYFASRATLNMIVPIMNHICFLSLCVQSCLAENPFNFLNEYKDSVSSATVSTAAFLSSANDIGIDQISDECGTDFAPIIENIKQLGQGLEVIMDSIRRSLDLVSCNKVSPIYRRVFNGPTCNESVYGLSCMFAAYFATIVFGMIMISLRAAMYGRIILENDDIEQENDEGDISSSTERGGEWEDYKVWMSNYYDTEEWKKQASPKNDELRPTGTFETDLSSQLSTDSADVSPEREGIPPPPLYCANEEESEPLSPRLHPQTRRGLSGFVVSPKALMKIFRDKSTN